MNITKKNASELGRKSSRKGVPNKSTTEIRESFNLLISETIPKQKKWLNEVAKENPAKALEIIAKFAEFVLPKLQRTEMTGSLSIEQYLQMTPEQRQARIIELTNKLDNDRKTGT